MEEKQPNFSATSTTQPTAPPTGSAYPHQPTSMQMHTSAPYPTTEPNVQPQIADIALTLGPDSVTINCPHCHNTVTTITESEPNNTAHLFCLLSFTMLCWPCCLIHYCMDEFQDVMHFCPSCGNFLGSYKP